MSRQEPPPARPGGDEPPDWVLPSWDALSDAEPAPRATRAVPAANASEPLIRPRPGLIPDEFRPAILGVTEVTHVVRDAVRADERLRDVWVEGEVGRVTISSAGHAYFTL